MYFACQSNFYGQCLQLHNITMGEVLTYVAMVVMFIYTFKYKLMMSLSVGYQLSIRWDIWTVHFSAILCGGYDVQLRSCMYLNFSHVYFMYVRTCTQVLAQLMLTPQLQGTGIQTPYLLIYKLYLKLIIATYMAKAWPCKLIYHEKVFKKFLNKLLQLIMQLYACIPLMIGTITSLKRLHMQLPVEQYPMQL